MDIELMKAAVTLEGVLSGTSAMELFAEVEALTAENTRIFAMVDAREQTIAELTALCDGYRGEVDRLKHWDSLLCPRCHGIGEITVMSGQTPESYSEENIPCPDCVGPIIDERDAAVSALTRARAEGMKEAAQIVDAECERILATQTGKQDDFNRSVDQQVRMVAVMLPEVAEAIRAKAKGEQ